MASCSRYKHYTVSQMRSVEVEVVLRGLTRPLCEDFVSDDGELPVKLYVRV